MGDNSPPHGILSRGGVYPPQFSTLWWKHQFSNELLFFVTYISYIIFWVVEWERRVQPFTMIMENNSGTDSRWVQDIFRNMVRLFEGLYLQKNTKNKNKLPAPQGLCGKSIQTQSKIG